MDQLISVIIPVYNVESYLPKCLDSVCGQTYSNLEIIVVNDGTKDQSQLIIDAYADRDKRIRKVIKPNGGLSSARNAGLEIASGDYVAFVDSDDWIAPGMLDGMLRKAKTSGSDIVVCNYDKVYDDRTERHYLPLKDGVVHVQEIGISAYMYRYLFTYAHGHEVWNKLYRRDLIERHRIRFEPNRDIFSEDLLFNLYVLCHANRIAAINEAYYFYLQREGSLMQLPSPQIGAQYATLVERFSEYCEALQLEKEVEAVLPILLYDLINASITRIYQASGGPQMITRTLKEMTATGSRKLSAYMRDLAFGSTLSLYRKNTGSSRSSDLFGRFFAVCCLLRLWSLFSGIKYKRLGSSPAWTQEV